MVPVALPRAMEAEDEKGQVKLKAKCLSSYVN
jgi:hypothetical protein